MNENERTNKTACFSNCEQVYRECLSQGNDEVFCRVRRVPCDSGCN